MSEHRGATLSDRPQKERCHKSHYTAQQSTVNKEEEEEEQEDVGTPPVSEWEEVLLMSI